jgi:hypothetical protein
MSIFAILATFLTIVTQNQANFCVTIRNGLAGSYNFLCMNRLTDLPTSAKASSDLLYGHSILSENNFSNLRFFST